MKKIELVLICLVFGLAVGCRKKPAEPQPMQVPPAVVSSSDVPAAVNTDSAAATANDESVSAIANTDTVQAMAKTESVSVTKSEPASKDRLAWMTDFAEAQKKAAAEGKDLFINFTGSDWCGWCIRLDKEVFSKPLFIYEAQKRFVFVYVDFPRNQKQSNTLKAQNEKLAQRYEVQGFPTIILATADGKPYAQTEYKEGGPMVYLEQLARLQLKKPAK